MIAGNILISLAAIAAFQTQDVGARTFISQNLAAASTETADPWSLDMYRGTAEGLRDSLIGIAAAPGGVTARNVDEELGIRLIKTQLYGPGQEPYPFYEVTAGQSWYFDVVVVEPHAPYGSIFSFGYPHLMPSAQLCINKDQLVKGLVAVGYSSAGTKVIEPEIPERELFFYKGRTEVHVDYVSNGCVIFFALNAPP